MKVWILYLKKILVFYYSLCNFVKPHIANYKKRVLKRNNVPGFESIKHK